jgi:hypothetical protein
MAKRGRPKSDRERYPGGQVRPPDAGVPYTVVHRWRAICADPIAEMLYGQMHMRREISDAQYAVASQINSVYRWHDKTTLAPRRDPGSPGFEVGVGRDTGSYETPGEWHNARMAKQAFDELQYLISRLPFNRGIKPAIEALCVANILPEPGWLPSVKMSLHLLAAPLNVKASRR